MQFLLPRLSLEVRTQKDDLGQLSARSNDDPFPGSATLGSNTLDNLHHIQALNNLSKDNVLAIEPRSISSAQKELRAISVRSGVGHGENSWASVLEPEVLIRELVAIDGLSTRAIVVGEVTTLAHEARDDAVEGGSGEPEALLASAELTEVLGGLGDDVGAELHDDAASRPSADGDVEENSGKRHGWCI